MISAHLIPGGLCLHLNLPPNKLFINHPDHNPSVPLNSSPSASL